MTHPCTISGVVSIAAGAGGLPTVTVTITNNHARAVIALHGATVLSYVPMGGTDVLWVSPQSAFAVDKPIRGGIPVCWPWFGPHATITTLPSHGVARMQKWDVVAAAVRHDGATVVDLEMPLTAAVLAVIPVGIKLRLRVTVGRSLDIELITSNHGPTAFTFGDALHTYFAVSDVRTTRVIGLEGMPYRDKMRAQAFAVQSGDIAFAGPTDRVYLPSPDGVMLDDGTRRLRIAKMGATATVVWNPWSENAARMSDIGAENWTGFACIEAANAYEGSVHLLPGCAHRTAQVIALAD